MIVHTEFQRLMDAYDDAAYRWATDLENESRRIMLDNYQAMQQRKRELYEWVVAHTPRPASAYRLIHRF